MAEAQASPIELAADLERIRTAVDGGATDLAALGFWRDVARVKRDPELIERFADPIGAIDTAAFRRAVRFRIPVWAGNALLLVGIVVGLAAAIGARSIGSDTIAGLLLLVAGVAWSVSFHGPAHWVVGRAVGIGFTDYLVGGPPPPRPGL